MIKKFLFFLLSFTIVSSFGSSQEVACDLLNATKLTASGKGRKHHQNNRLIRSKCRKNGPTGPTGLPGLDGAAGAAGASGSAGAEGLPGSGSIIPYASGSNFSLTVNPNGTPNAAAILGFGIASSAPAPLANPIDLFSSPSNLLCSAIMMPRAGTITAISAYLSTLAGSSIALDGAIVIVRAQLYESIAPDNLFTPIASSLVTLSPTLTGTISSPVIATGSLTGLNIPVANGSRLIMVISASSSGSTSLLTLPALLSAGVTIE